MKKVRDFFQVAGCQGIGKAGAVNWTVGKLLNIVLLVVLLVLIIYGMTTGGLNPLKENLEMKFEEVKIMIGFSDYDDSPGGCYTSKVSDLGGGDEFLDRSGLAGEEVLLDICDDGSCVVIWEDGEAYRIKSGKFEVRIGEDWVAFDLALSGNLDEAKFHWELYNGAADVLDGTSVRGIYDKRVTRSFVLYGDGAGVFDDEILATWRNGAWQILEGDKVVYNRTDDAFAIDLFYDRVEDMYDDHVFYREGGVEIRGVASIGMGGVISEENIKIASERLSGEGTGWNTINELVGGDNIKLDSAEEKGILIEKFLEIRRRLTDEAKLGADEVLELKGIVDDKSFEVGDDVFEMGAEDSRFGYVITLSSGDVKYGLRFNADERLVAQGDVKLRAYPLSLVVYVDGDWRDEGDEESYKLPEYYFEDGYRGSSIDKFIREKCR